MTVTAGGRAALRAAFLATVAMAGAGFWDRWSREGAPPLLVPLPLDEARRSLRAGRWVEAAAEYRAHVRLDPSALESWFYLGFTLARAGDEPQLRAEYDRVRETDPRAAAQIAAGAERGGGRLRTRPGER